MSLRIHLKRPANDVRVDPAGVKRFARAVLRGEGVSEGEATVVLCDDAGIRDLNARFRGRDRATDVLAFPFGEEDDPALPGEEGGPYLGDVVVSMDRAREQAPRFGNDPEAELARLVTHGLLHLLGYDHHSPGEGRRMKGAERRALAHYRPGSLLRSGGGA